MSRLEKVMYEAKYTACTYLDSALSIPIWAGEKIAKGSEKILGERNPDFLSWEKMKGKSQFYKGREKLRDRLDTRPGSLYVQSNAIALVPFFAAGIPAAEFAAKGIEAVVENAPELAKHITNSTITLAAQMFTGYSAFVGNEVLRTNRGKFVNEENRISARKVGSFTWDSVKTFWKFDLTYIVLKSALQTVYLMNGWDPGDASAIADAWGLPAWSSVMLALGLRGGLIETNRTDEIYGREKAED